MMSSNPTSYPGWSETICTPYPPSSCTVPGSPQPQGLINLGNQTQGGQLPFITAPGILATHQLGQENMQVINSAIGKYAIKFKEEAKALGFIISGSLAISASKEFSPCLLKSSLGMNIVSSIFAIIGVILLLVDMSINGIYLQNYGSVISGKGISAMLMIFSLLEFCVTCTTAHFSSQTITMSNKPVTVIPTVYTVNPMTPESSSAPSRTNGYPAYTTNY
uniref:Membrane spanning 4-domains A12 n=1 Tax=Oryctolagus cuniculus TaxID=9986 RepID=G1SU49_RABIT